MKGLLDQTGEGAREAGHRNGPCRHGVGRRPKQTGLQQGGRCFVPSITNLLNPCTSCYSSPSCPTETAKSEVHSTTTRRMSPQQQQRRRRGRPPKYTTEQERAEACRSSKLKSYHKQRTRTKEEEQSMAGPSNATTSWESWYATAATTGPSTARKLAKLLPAATRRENNVKKPGWQEHQRPQGTGGPEASSDCNIYADPRERGNFEIYVNPQERGNFEIYVDPQERYNFDSDANPREREMAELLLCMWSHSRP